MKTEKKEELKKIIRKSLTPLIDNDYVLLDVPYHYNIGDVLIWNGELDFLDEIPYKHLNFGFHYQNYKINENTIILLHGGGNFGDLWRGFQEYRLNIICKYPKNKIIIFPQTIYYQNEDLMKKDAKLMSLHPNLTICARDEISFNILKKNFNNNILLVPDMAFYISEKKILKYVNNQSEKKILIKRNDKELLSDKLPVNENEFDVYDWPTQDGTLEMYCMWDNRLLKASRRCSRKPILKIFAPFFIRLNDLYIQTYLRKKITKIGVSFISRYKLIYTTRLHGAILAFILKRSVVIIDNSYGKNKNFYNTWLSDADNIKII